MKKILALIICVLLICATPIIAFAEGNPSDAIEQDTTEEIFTEGENPGTETETDVGEEKSITESIVEYMQIHFEEISVVITLVVTLFYQVRNNTKIKGSVGTLNNNAITIAEKSASAIQEALSGVEDVANTVNKYKDDIASLLEEIRKNAEEKESLEETLKTVKTFLETAKLASLELSNEVAELLVLANIPNSKKEELYARHMQAVKALEVKEEVMSDDGTEA